MKDTILGEIYSSLTKEELKKLNKYMKFSEWSDSETILKCHEMYSTSIKEKDRLNFTKKQLFQFIYGDETYNDSKLRFTQNRLLNAIKQFIINHEFEKENIFSSKIWMDFLLDKKLKKNLQYHSREDKFIANSDYRYLNEYFKSQEESYIYFQNPKEQEKQYQSIQKIIIKAQNFSDLVFIRNFCSLISFTKTYKSIPVTLPLEKLEEIKLRVDQNQNPEFKVYFYLIDLLINQTEKSYEKYKEFLFKTIDEWDDQEKVNLIFYLLNYTTQQINKGNIQYIEEQFNLYEEFEENKIFQIQYYMSHIQINNVVNIYLRKNEFEKAEKFLNTYIHYLDIELKDSCWHFNLARILFEKSKYKECLRELLQVDFSKNASYSLNSKVLLLKTYYELEEFDALDSLFISFNEFIQKNKIFSDAYKSNYINFNKTLKKIFTSTVNKLKNIQSEIESSQNIAEKKWLLEKLQYHITHSKAKS